METFNAKSLLARVSAGFKGGKMFTSPITHPSMSIVEGWSSKTAAQLHSKGFPQSTPTAPWNGRR
jgi:hypothetical protein